MPYDALISAQIPMIMVSTAVYENLDAAHSAGVSSAGIGGLLRQGWDIEAWSSPTISNVRPDRAAPAPQQCAPTRPAPTSSWSPQPRARGRRLTARCSPRRGAARSPDPPSPRPINASSRSNSNTPAHNRARVSRIEVTIPSAQIGTSESRDTRWLTRKPSAEPLRAAVRTWEGHGTPTSRLPSRCRCRGASSLPCSGRDLLSPGRLLAAYSYRDLRLSLNAVAPPVLDAHVLHGRSHRSEAAAPRRPR